MNEKISFPDLVALLAAKLNVTKKEAEAFLKEFFTVSTEVISSGEELRINELGVFKPIWVEPRASVNVQTGEPVEIPGHYKLSFVPDKVLREAVNAPFSSFSVEILNDHVSTEAMMAVDEDELLGSRDTDSPEEDLLAAGPAAVMSADSDAAGEVAPATESERVEPEEVPTGEMADSEPLNDAVPETPVSDPNPEMPAASERNETTVAETEAEVETPPTIEPIEATPASATEEQAVKTSALVPVDTEEERDYHEYLQKSASRRAFWLGALSGLGAVVVIVAAVWFFLRDDDGIKIGEYTLSLTGSEVFAPQPVANPVTDTVVIPETVDTVVEGTATSSDTVPLARESASQNVKTTGLSAQVAPAVGQPSSEPVIETIRSGVFLTTLSRKYFGHKAFWVYIYEENKGVIKNPNQVPIGTRVVIPDAAKYHIDAKNSRSVDEAKALAVKILSRYE
ncbi:HU family DNA-binding protein [Barnesiella viscericola]|uniref:HU family DNA-binding protein n=1 Tax=Barnesiella viscericola TaxID=397865 RepID=UPI00255BA184|nr:HU family DNA-binding protein [Barnesiella viscericola]